MRTPDNATAYMPAIAALRSDLADLERQAAETRALIDGLCARAGIAGEPAALPGEPAVPSSAGHELMAKQPKSKAGRKNRVSKKPDSPKPLADRGIDKAAAKPDLTAAVAEWEKILASRAEAIADAESATRDKDPAKLKAAIAARAQLERRLGTILTIIDGKIRPLPGLTDRNARERWKAFAKLSEPDFEAKLRRSQRSALSAIGVKPEKPATRPQQAMKISAWRVEPDGSRSRTVTAVDGGAEAL